MTISNTTMSDEATYYCALVFADGTYLKIKGRSSTNINLVKCSDVWLFITVRMWSSEMLTVLGHFNNNDIQTLHLVSESW